MAAETTKRRSEYRRDLGRDLSTSPVPPVLAVRPVDENDAPALAVLLLDAYRGTVDDDGEDEADARQAIDHYLAKIRRPYSVVLTEGIRLAALSFVVIVGDVHYIDPVATAAADKGRGYGTAAVTESIRLLAAAGIAEVGAVVTDGNTASERLFAGLGFVRVGAWARGGPAP